MAKPDRSSGSGSTRGVGQFGKFLTAYRGHLSRAEAARRAGVPEARWAEIESCRVPALREAGGPTVSAHTVAAMCVAVGADIATGLRLAGHDPCDYEYLLASPPRVMYLRGRLSPGIAVYRAIIDAVAVPGGDPRPTIAAIYRDVAEQNYRLADRILQAPPDDRTAFWAGYASALRAIADEQSQMADQESTNRN